MAAKFRGGDCLSENMKKGNLSEKLKWKCGHCGAEFEASPALILLGGHWCPECFIPQKNGTIIPLQNKSFLCTSMVSKPFKKVKPMFIILMILFHINGVKWDDIKNKHIAKGYILFIIDRSYLQKRQFLLNLPFYLIKLIQVYKKIQL